MNKLTNHNRMMLGLDEAWLVKSVDLSMEAKRVVIALAHRGGRLTCPECGVSCTRADLAPKSTGRHLDTMQFETILQARTPRRACEKCGVKPVDGPWAGKHSRFTLMFEVFAIRVLEACSSVKQAAALLRLDWDTVQGIMRRAVERALESRETEQITRIDIDEKSFLRGHSYVSVMTDISGARVLKVVEGCTEEAADSLWKTLSEEQRSKVQAVAMDMWPAFVSSTGKNAPSASIVFDRFHVSKHLNEAVDQVRRQESKSLKKEGDTRLTGTKQMWLFNPENLSFNRLLCFSELKEQALKTGRAWAMKEQFRLFWECFSRVTSVGFFEQWYDWASKSKLTPIVAKAEMLKRHLPGLLNHFKHRLTNAMSEGFNSKIQQDQIERPRVSIVPGLSCSNLVLLRQARPTTGNSWPPKPPKNQTCRIGSIPDLLRNQ
jgi:transposase